MKHSFPKTLLEEKSNIIVKLLNDLSYMFKILNLKIENKYIFFLYLLVILNDRGDDLDSGRLTKLGKTSSS